MPKEQRTYRTLLAWREDLGLTQEQAARELGVSQSYYSRLEQGESTAGKKLGRRISDRAGVPLETVLGL